MEPCELFSLEEVLSLLWEDGLDRVEQLKLAAKLAKVVLQFHSTPWLHAEWALKDLRLFAQKSQISETDFETLHLSSHMPNRSGSAASSPSMEGVKRTGGDSLLTAEKVALENGIINITLFNLGVALLEIGLWKPLKSFYGQQDAEAIHTARRVANGRHSEDSQKSHIFSFIKQHSQFYVINILLSTESVSSFTHGMQEAISHVQAWDRG